MKYFSLYYYYDWFSVNHENIAYTFIHVHWTYSTIFTKENVSFAFASEVGKSRTANVTINYFFSSFLLLMLMCSSLTKLKIFYKKIVKVYNTLTFCKIIIILKNSVLYL